MVIVKATKNSEAGVMPSEQLLTEMGKYNEELAKAGVLLAGEGLHPSSKGARVKFSETKELVAGFWLGSASRCKRRSNGSNAVPIPCQAKSPRSRFGRYSKPEDFGPALTPSFACRKSDCARKLRKIKAHELPSEETLVKYIALDTSMRRMGTMSESDQNALMDQCFAYDDVLRKNGHFVGGEALQSATERHDAAMPERQGVHHRWPVCRDERAVGRHPHPRGDGSEPRHPIDVEAPGCEGRPVRDSPG